MYVCQKACFHSHLQGLPNIPTLAAALSVVAWVITLLFLENSCNVFAELQSDGSVAESNEAC